MKGGKWGYRLPANPLFARIYWNLLDVYGLTWKGNKNGYLVPRAGLELASILGITQISLLSVFSVSRKIIKKSHFDSKFCKVATKLLQKIENI